MNAKATVVSIHIAPTGGAPMQSAQSVEALVDRGLKGDRYATQLGTNSGYPGSGREVTLIEIEAIEALQRDYRIELKAGQARRNIVTCGVALNHLVNRVRGRGGCPARRRFCWTGVRTSAGRSADAVRIAALGQNPYRMATTPARGNGYGPARAYILVLTAMQYPPVSYVAPAREISILIGTVMGARLLAEDDAGRRLVAAVAMVMGIIGLAVG